MSRDRIIIVGLVAVLVMRQVPGDSMEAFACGGIVGIVLGAVLGAAFNADHATSAVSEEDSAG